MFSSASMPTVTTYRIPQSYLRLKEALILKSSSACGRHFCVSGAEYFKIAMDQFELDRASAETAKKYFCAW